MGNRIIIALGDYYPDPSANGICVEKIVEAFKKRGYQIDLVVNDSSKLKHKQEISGTTIHFVRQSFAWSLSTLETKKKRRSYRLIIRFIRRLIAFLRLPFYCFSFPAESVITCGRYKRIIRKIVSNNNQVVAIIGVNKPVEAFLGAYHASKKEKLPMIGYLLDPLVGGYSFPFFKEKFYMKLFRFEERIIQYANLTIFMDEHKEEYFKRYGNRFQNKVSFLGVPMLENKSHWKEVGYNKQKRIIYAGTVYQDIRNPEYIMDVFKYVKNAKLIMYVSNPHEWINNFNNSNIEIKGRVSHKMIMEEFLSADALLNIGNSSQIFAPSKVVEYIGFCKPIISTYRISNDTSLNYLNRYPDALCIDERTEKKETAAKLIDDYLDSPRKTVGYEEIERRFWNNRPEAFVEKVLEHIFMGNAI